MKSLTVTLLVVLTIVVCLAETEYEMDERGSGIFGKVIQKGKYMEQEGTQSMPVYFINLFSILLRYIF